MPLGKIYKQTADSSKKSLRSLLPSHCGPRFRQRLASHYQLPYLCKRSLIRMHRSVHGDEKEDLNSFECKHKSACNVNRMPGRELPISSCIALKNDLRRSRALGSSKQDASKILLNKVTIGHHHTRESANGCFGLANEVREKVFKPVSYDHKENVHTLNLTLKQSQPGEGSSIRDFQGRRALHPSASDSSEEENPVSSPNKPNISFQSCNPRKFTMTRKSIGKEVSKIPQRQQFDYGHSSNGEDDCVQFVREFKNVKTASPPSPKFPSRKSRKIVLKQSPLEKYERGCSCETSFTKSKELHYSVAQIAMNHEIEATVSVNKQSNHKLCSETGVIHKNSVISKTENRNTCSSNHLEKRREKILDQRHVIQRKQMERPIVEEDTRRESEDDDIIVIATDGTNAQNIDYLHLKRIVTTMVSNLAEEKVEEEITPHYVINRLKALYHQDFSHRLLEIQHCLNRAKQRQKSSQKLLRVVRPGLRKSDIITLLPENWLNDIIINHYMSIVVKDNKKHGAISSFCYEEILRSKQPSLPENWQRMNSILMPICIDSHWSLMCLLPQSMNIAIYNSMPITGPEFECANILLQYFRHKANLQDVGSCLKVESLPQQENEYDCGVYVCMFARCIVCGNSFNIKPVQVLAFRKWLKNEIVQGKLFGTGEEISDTVIEDSDSDSAGELNRDNHESGIECLE